MTLSGRLKACDTRNNQIVFQSAWKMRGSEKAIRQLSKPHSRASRAKKSGAVLKLSPRISATGKTK